MCWGTLEVRELLKIFALDFSLKNSREVVRYQISLLAEDWQISLFKQGENRELNNANKLLKMCLLIGYEGGDAVSVNTPILRSSHIKSLLS